MCESGGSRSRSSAARVKPVGIDAEVVIVLAGGRGSRLGGDKAMVRLGGVPLIDRPLRAARAAGLRAVVVAKRGTALPEAETWLEPDTPTHPLLGLITALERGGPVVAVACDQPWVTPELLHALATHEGPAIAVEREPFPGRYDPHQLPVLRDALDHEASLRATLGRLQPAVLGADRALVAGINTPEDLERAEHA